MITPSQLLAHQLVWYAERLKAKDFESRSFARWTLYFLKKTKLINAYDAGYDAGLNGANTDNCHFGWFNTPENRDEWQRGNKDGSYQREQDKKPIRERIKSTFKK